MTVFWEILANRFSVLSEFYIYYYRDVIQRKIELVDIDSSDVILNISCNGISFTAIHIAIKIGAQVYAIDRERNDPTPV